MDSQDIAGQPSLEDMTDALERRGRHGTADVVRTVTRHGIAYLLGEWEAVEIFAASDGQYHAMGLDMRRVGDGRWTLTFTAADVEAAS